MKDTLQVELTKLKANLLEQIKEYETQPVETSDELITQGWLEAIEHVEQLIKTREYLENMGESK
jgi:hypothetical protein|tara:strand:- start:1789 stop:1980 length:192 start_codon:yes stop_codon:yes gene_type:complete